MPRNPPGIARDPALHARLGTAWAAMGADHHPRTQLWDGAAPRYVNRLIEAASPYLLQHAHNPVDWHAWGTEALAEAAARDCPIFLSAGYATCHWCHVMEEESFDDEAVAAALNSDFVAIKIDREEHPDLDHIFLMATQLQQNQAGWPNSVWLTPEGLPFHTGGYFSKRQFLEILNSVDNAWKSQEGRHEIAQVSTRLAEGIRRFTHMKAAREAAVTADIFDDATRQLMGMYNAEKGGFSTSQQFPQEGFLLYLLDHWRRGGDSQALNAVIHTLDAITAGGMHDHVGGGFHRYTVDPGWQTPHFEKMAYNQALLSRILIEAWEETRNPSWKRAVTRCFDYVARDMTDADGAFFAAEDADSADANGQRAEGAFYRWSCAEAETVIGDPALAARLGFGPNSPRYAVPRLALEGAQGSDLATFDPVLERMRQAREQRPRPARDVKVIAGWNGLMIRALAEGAMAFGPYRFHALDSAAEQYDASLAGPRYAAQALRAAEAIWARLWDGQRLARFAVGARVGAEGALEDYAWLGLGFLALADATGEALWQERAVLLSDVIRTRFADGEGRLKMMAEDGPLGPVYDSADSATPSGESSALELLARLDLHGADPAIRAEAEALCAAIAPAMAEAPLLRADALVAARILADGESGRRRVLAGGRLRAAMADRVLYLDLTEGWHIPVGEDGAPDGLVMVSLEGAEADWTEGAVSELELEEFPGATVPGCSGRLQVGFKALQGVLTLHLQLCSEQRCLAPLAATFRVHGE